MQLYFCVQLSFFTMAIHVGKKSDIAAAPLYHDLFEFINVMGIKQNRVIEAFGVGRSNWYNLKQHHLAGISLKNMHSFATYFGLPLEKVISLCYITYTRGVARQQVPEVERTKLITEFPPAQIDADFPPIN